MTARQPAEKDEVTMPAWNIFTIGVLVGGLLVLGIAMYFGPTPSGFAP